MNIAYIHTVRIFDTTVDEYGKQTATGYHDVPAVFEQSVSWTHTSNRDDLDSDAVALVDPNDPYIAGNKRLEESMVIANPHGGDEPEQWFKIESTTVGQYHQLSGEINTVYLRLKKTRALEYVS